MVILFKRKQSGSLNDSLKAAEVFQNVGPGVQQDVTPIGVCSVMAGCVLLVAPSCKNKDTGVFVADLSVCIGQTAWNTNGNRHKDHNK